MRQPYCTGAVSSETEVNPMAARIDDANLGGSLQMDDDGSLIFTRDDLSKAEVMNVEQAISRWPHLEALILAALKQLPG